MQPSPVVNPVFLLEVVIIIVVEGMRLVATKKLRKQPTMKFDHGRWHLPGTPTLPVEIVFPKG
jgi:hypothetical protein